MAAAVHNLYNIRIWQQLYLIYKHQDMAAAVHNLYNIRIWQQLYIIYIISGYGSSCILFIQYQDMASAVKRIKVWLGLSPPAFAEEESNWIFYIYFNALLLWYAAHHSVAAAHIRKDDAFRCLVILQYLTLTAQIQQNRQARRDTVTLKKVSI